MHTSEYHHQAKTTHHGDPGCVGRVFKPSNLRDVEPNLVAVRQTTRAYIGRSETSPHPHRSRLSWIRVIKL